MDTKNIKSPLQFSGLRIINFNFETNEVNEKNSEVNIEFNIDFDTKNYIETKDEFSATFILYIKANTYTKNQKIFSLNFNVECNYYCSDSSFDKDLFLNSILFNGIISCSQFSRNYIRSVLLLAGVQPIIDLPLIDPNKMIQEKFKKNKN